MLLTKSNTNLDLLPQTDTFARRHFGSNEGEISKMLQAVGVDSIEQLIEETVPDSIRLRKRLNLPEAKTESEGDVDLMKIFKELTELTNGEPNFYSFFLKKKCISNNKAIFQEVNNSEVNQRNNLENVQSEEISLSKSNIDDFNLLTTHLKTKINQDNNPNKKHQKYKLIITKNVIRKIAKSVLHLIYKHFIIFHYIMIFFYLRNENFNNHIKLQGKF